MTDPPFTPIEVSEPSAYAAGKRVAFGDLAKRFGKRWYIDTSIGRVFFKRLGQLDRDTINIQYADEHPEFVEVVREAETLREFARNGIPLDEAHKKKMSALDRALIPIERMYAMACIVDIAEDGAEKAPFARVEDYDAFLSALLPEEVDAVYGILREMVSTAPLSEESHVVLALAKEYGIPLADGLTAENMTAEIADALAENAKARCAAARREAENMQGG